MVSQDTPSPARALLRVAWLMAVTGLLTSAVPASGLGAPAAPASQQAQHAAVAAAGVFFGPLSLEVPGRARRATGSATVMPTPAATAEVPVPADLLAVDPHLADLAAQLHDARLALARALTAQQQARSLTQALTAAAAERHRATAEARDTQARARLRLGKFVRRLYTSAAFAAGPSLALLGADQPEQVVGVAEQAHLLRTLREEVEQAGEDVRAGEAAEADLRARLSASTSALGATAAALSSAQTQATTLQARVDAAFAAARVAAADLRAERARLATAVAAAGPPSPQAAAWLTTALQLLYRSGYPRSADDPADLSLIISRESGWDPTSVNDWDSNARAGHPSFGLMQTIPSTFDAYALPGHTDHDDPVAQIVAGARYALARYGGLAAVPGVLAVRAGQPYVGY